jgi:phosphoenolpyruvate---glycerone phosphotransferase subunit DhaL
MNTQDLIAGALAVQRALLAQEADIESLDRAIGDGDHFINVSRGCEVVTGMAAEVAPLPPSQAFHKIGMKLLSTIGGASGPLISSFFMALGKSLDGVAEPHRLQFATAFAAGVEAIKHRGKADLGEKTMLDVLIPVSRLMLKLAQEGLGLPATCERLTAEAERGMLATRDMVATKGRAHFLGERALGHIDPGSKTCAVAIGAVCQWLTAKETSP